MTHKRRSKCAAKKYNLKILRRYHSLYPRDTYFASLPASCLHREENDQHDEVLDSSTADNNNAILRFSSSRCIPFINTNFVSTQAINDTTNEEKTLSNHRTIDVNEIESSDNVSINTLSVDHSYNYNDDDNLDNDNDDHENNYNSESENVYNNDSENDENVNTENYNIASADFRNTSLFYQNISAVPLPQISRVSARDHFISVMTMSLKNYWSYESSLQ
ncbi:hypothetical protein PV326_000443, partial [Microctonus aethiopoides]